MSPFRHLLPLPHLSTKGDETQDTLLDCGAVAEIMKIIQKKDTDVSLRLTAIQAIPALAHGNSTVQKTIGEGVMEALIKLLPLPLDDGSPFGSASAVESSLGYIYIYIYI
jgi:hypothetical protein